MIPNVGNDIRNSYFLWLEPEVPTFAMEVTSPSTHRRDREFQTQPVRKLGRPGVLAIRSPRNSLNAIVAGQPAGGWPQYQPIPVDVAPGRFSQCASAYSQLLKLEFLARREWFRFRDPITGRIIPNRQEAERELLEAQSALGRERSARRELEDILRQHGIEPPTAG